MAKATPGLTAKRVQALKVAGKYHDSQGPVRGLHLQVGANGSKSWLLRYEFDKRERWMGLGSAADFSLKEARERARAARQLLADGVDPIDQRLAQRDTERKERAANILFKEAVQKFLKVHGDLWRSAKHRRQWLTTLNTYATPLMDRRVRDIDIGLINETLAAHWTRVPYSMARVRQRIERVIKWVVDGMPLPAANGKHNHHPALPWSELPRFMEELRARQGNDARALELLVLTAARTNEVIGMRWDEVDFEQRLWVVSEARMKAARPHRVPLSDRALEILQSLPTEASNDRVFIGVRKGGGIGHNALLDLFKKMRSGLTVHGFRATFKTWCDEAQHVENAVVEAALAHVAGDTVEQAYRRGDMIEKRRKLMQDWADFCASQPAKVVPLREAVR